MNNELRRVARSILVVGLVGAAACGEESPTNIGGSLLPGPSVETFEVILDASDYLVSDTSFSGYIEPFQSVNAYGYLLFANEFDGALNARALAEFEIPESITVTDSTGVEQTDSMPEFVGGELVVIVDTLRTSSAPVTVQAFRATQSWDPSSVDWTMRVDTGGEQLSWSEPGGSPGALAGTGTWTEADTLRIPINAETIEAWRDTTNVSGVVLVPGAGTRMRTARMADGALGLELRVDAESSIVDTVVTLTADGPTDPIFIFDPPAPAESSDIRVAGSPSWRSFLQFRERLDTLTVPCPGDSEPPGCRVALRDVSISYAALLLDPVAPPAGFAPEGNLQLGATLLLVDPLIPIERSPIGSAVGLMPEPLPASRFSDPAEAPVELMVTQFVSLMTRDSADVNDRPSPDMALFEASGLVGSTGRIGQFQSTEGLTFGFATFASRPRLRLLLTVPGDLGLR